MISVALYKYRDSGYDYCDNIQYKIKSIERYGRNKDNIKVKVECIPANTTWGKQEMTFYGLHKHLQSTSKENTQRTLDNLLKNYDNVIPSDAFIYALDTYASENSEVSDTYLGHNNLIFDKDIFSISKRRIEGEFAYTLDVDASNIKGFERILFDNLPNKARVIRAAKAEQYIDNLNDAMKLMNGMSFGELTTRLDMFDSNLSDIANNLTAWNLDLDENGDANISNALNFNKEDKEKENKEMNLFNDVRMGKAGSGFSISFYGTIAFNGKTCVDGKLYDAQGMTVPFDMLYLVPATQLEKNDTFVKNNEVFTVVEVDGQNVTGINLDSGKKETFVPGGPFGMTIYSKVFNPMGDMTKNSNGNSFGNMLMLQSLMGDKRGSGDNSMLMAMMMMQGGFKFPTFEFPTVNANVATENKEEK